MANTRFLPFPKLLYIIRVRVLVEPAGDKPFSFFFSVPGKDSIDRIEIRLQFLLAARRKQRSVGGNHFHFPSADCRLLLHDSTQRRANGRQAALLFLLGGGELSQGVATLHPGWRRRLGHCCNRVLRPTTNMNSSLCESRTTSTTWRRTRAPDL